MGTKLDLLIYLFKRIARNKNLLTTLNILSQPHPNFMIKNPRKSSNLEDFKPPMSKLDSLVSLSEIGASSFWFISYETIDCIKETIASSS